MLTDRLNLLVRSKVFPMQVNGKPHVYCGDHGSNPALSVTHLGQMYEVCKDCFFKLCPEMQPAVEVKDTLPATVKVKCYHLECSATIDRLDNCCICHAPCCAEHRVGQVCERCIDDEDPRAFAL